MARYKSRTERRAQSKKYRAMASVAAISILAVVGGGWFLKVRHDRLSLDSHQCPPNPEAYTAVLVDVTDPMTLPQSQDLRNKFEQLKRKIRKGERLAIFKVDATTSQLLQPILEVCNPGDSSDFSDVSGDPKAAQKLYDAEFEKPLRDAFERIAEENKSDRSPILQSMQSITLTELKKPSADGKRKTLIVVSDLLQNTSGLSFYHRLPTAEEVVKSGEFTTARTDLRDVDVELWMLQRADTASTQPMALIDLWKALIEAEGGSVASVYRVSG